MYRHSFKPLALVIALLAAGILGGCGSGGGGGGGGNPNAASSGPIGGVCQGAACVSLGTAGHYAILAKSAISTVPSSAVTGHVGLSPAARTALTGWSLITQPTDTYFTSAQVDAPGHLYAADNVGGTTSSDLSTAVLNMQTAYTDAVGRTATSAATTNVGAGTLTSLTLTPGIYEWGTSVNIPTDLTFSGNSADVWILKVAGTLDMAAAKNVVLSWRRTAQEHLLASLGCRDRWNGHTF